VSGIRGYQQSNSLNALYTVYNLCMKKSHVTLAIVVVVMLVAVFVWKKNEERQALILSNPPVEQLLFIKKIGGEFTLEQKQTIEEFKAKLLVRAGLGVTLTENEKGIFTAVMFDQAAVFPNGGTVVNQSVLKFSTEEIDLISSALKK